MATKDTKPRPPTLREIHQTTPLSENEQTTLLLTQLELTKDLTALKNLAQDKHT